MILADTSAWVEFRRKTGSSTHLRLRGLVGTAELVTTDVVAMEVLAFARGARELRELRDLVAGCEFVPVEGPGDYEAAAGLHRDCRAGGTTIRRLTDCLIAAVAIRADLEVLPLDRDFDAIAGHTALRLV
ncbi:MAG: PIN domain nuclease [Actinomycetota bacterium]|nr:PIN domain nuclease [Actinomycetota bacterium]